MRLGAVAANYRTYRRLAGPTAVAAVVKADAYGLGASRVAPELAQAGCDSFFVARLQEGVSLRKLLPRARIFVLDGASPDAVPALISFSLTPVLNSLSEIAAWSAAAGVGQSALDAVIHVDTGMNRLGLCGDELAQLSGEKAKAASPGLNLVLVMSHLACSDDPANRAQRAQQLSRPRQALAMLPPCARQPRRHAMAPCWGMEYHFDLVRPGIALYGANPQVREGGAGGGAPNLVREDRRRPHRPGAAAAPELTRAKALAAEPRSAPKGPPCLPRSRLDMPYGFPRTLSNKGIAVLNGARVPVVGRISMDLMILDVTDLPEAPRVGDEAELLGDRITLGEVAAMAATNEYEILTRLRRSTEDYDEG